MIRVGVVDDHDLIREGIKKILENEEDFLLAGEARSAEEAAEMLERSSGEIDVLVLDLGLPDKSGLELLKDIKAARYRVGVLVLTRHPEERYGVRALKNGAAGYLTKESSSEEIKRALRKVGSGSSYVGPRLAEELAKDFSRVRGEKLPHEKLSDREFQILRMLAAGARLSDIAETLHLSYNTVKTYRLRLFEKLELETDGEAFVYALHHDLID
jgi:DNA-binding NarL/FixJ family response regulator